MNSFTVWSLTAKALMEKFRNDDVLTTEKGKVSYRRIKELKLMETVFEVCL